MRQLGISFLVLFISAQGISHGSDLGAPENMVLIPAGPFTMGSDDGGSNEKPVHKVYLDAYYIDKYEVTNEQFCKFLNEKSNQTEDRAAWLVGDEDCLIQKSGSRYSPKSGRANHPVIQVTWYGATAYAKWAGKKLPTEAEWEKAARGGLEGKKYPWGNQDPSGKANYGRSYEEGNPKTKPIGSYSPNGYGLYDMAGNVWEWCADRYGSGYYKYSSQRSPKGPSFGNYRIVRSGSWYGNAKNLRCAIRLYHTPDNYWDNHGFRCASSPE